MEVAAYISLGGVMLAVVAYVIYSNVKYALAAELATAKAEHFRDVATKQASLIRKKNEYIKKTEQALIGTADIDTVIGILNGMFENKDRVSGDFVPSLDPSGEADPPLGSVIGPHSPTSD